MQHKIATKIVGFFAQRNLIAKDNVDWCVYFIETRIFSYVALLLFFSSYYQFLVRWKSWSFS